MEAELTTKELSFFRCSCRREATQEETIEVLIGDDLPDAATIIDAEPSVFLRSKECEDGQARLRCAIEGSILYSTEDGRLCTVPFRSECRMEWTAQELKRDGLLCAKLRLQKTELRVINPRKLLLHTELCGSISQWMSESVRYASAAENIALEQRREVSTVPIVSAVSEKSFAVTEQFALSGDCERIESILLHRCTSHVEEWNSVAGKLILQGKSQLELLYTDELGSLCTRSFTSSWSQLMDVPAEPEQSAITLMDTARYVDIVDGGEAVSLEVHLTAQLRCTASAEIETLTDAYSTTYETELRREALVLTAFSTQPENEKTLRSSAELPEDPDKLLFSRGEVEKEIGGSYTLAVRGLYLDREGRLKCWEKKLDCASDAEPALQSLKCSQSGKGLELSAVLDESREEEESTELRWIGGITLLEDKPIRKRGLPGLVIVRRNGAEPWDLAKKFGSTVALMEKANENMDEKDAFLFIPRAR